MASTERNWTEEQKRAIQTRDRTLLLSAAAGSGKTAVLTERLIRALTEGEHPLDLSRIMAVTFTRTAAAELRIRIGKALSEAIQKNPDSEHLARQLRLLPVATISTIDSFCISLLRRFPMQAGVSDGFRIFGNQEKILLRTSVMERLVVEGYAGRIEGVTTEDFCRLISHLTNTRKEGGFPDILLGLVEQLEYFPEGVGFALACAENYERDATRSVSETKWGKLLEREASEMAHYHICGLERNMAAAESGAGICQKLKPKLDVALEEMKRFLDSIGRGYEAMREVSNTLEYPKTITCDKNHDLSCEEESAIRYAKSFKAELTGSNGKIKQLLLYTERQWKELFLALGRECRTLWRVVDAFEKNYMAECRRRCAYDFSQIERLTYDLLLSNGQKTEVARTLEKEYDAVCIDEYQDVNPLQHAIFEALSGERTRFLVGDIKQSIFRFRHAEPDIFAQLRASMPPLDEGTNDPVASHFMSTNFRSDSSVIDFVNGVFTVLFGAAGESIGYTTQDDLICGKKQEEGMLSFPPVVAFFDSNTAQKQVTTEQSIEENTEPNEKESQGQTPKMDADTDTEEIENREAKWVAAQIKQLLDNGTLHDGVTPLQPGDIAILMRSANSRYRPFVEALSVYGIRCAKPEDTGFLSTPEVLLALALLSAVDNPRRDVALAGVLCSPLYHFTPDDLFAIRRQTPEGLPLYDALCQYCENNPDFTRGHFFLKQLDSFRETAEGMPVDKLLGRLYSETPLAAIAGADTEGGEINLRLLRSYARTYEGAAFEGLYSFIHFINRQIEKGATFNPPPAEGEDGAVHILTIHKSKGLEYPVVFLAGCGGDFSSADVRKPVLCEGSAGLAFQLAEQDKPIRVDNPVRGLLAHLITERNTEEELRLLYVALTRARERLYISGTVKRNSSIETMKNTVYQVADFPVRYSVMRLRSYMGMILTALQKNPTFAKVDFDPPLPTEGELKNKKVVSKTVESAEELEKELSERFSYVYPYAHLATLPKKLSVSSLYPGILDGTEEESVTLPVMADKAEALSNKEGHAEKKHRMPVAVAGTRPPDPTDRGTATHLFMQFCDFDQLAEHGVEPEIRRLIDKKYMDEETAALIRKDELELFRRSALLVEMRTAKRVRREFRFHINLPADTFTEAPTLKEKLACETLFVQGAMDALIEHEDGTLTLIDYKTDRLSAAELASPELITQKMRMRHGQQLRYYAEAAKRICGRAPDAVQLYLLQLGDTVDMDVEKK